MTRFSRQTVSLISTIFFGLTSVFAQDDIPPQTPPPTPDSSSLWVVPIKMKSYKSAVYKVKFNYPNNWSEVPMNNGAIVTLGGLDSKHDTFPDMLSLRVEYIGTAISEEKRKQILDTLAKVRYPGTELVNNNRFTADSTQFAEQTVRGKVGGRYGQYKYVICIKNGFLYTFSFLYNPTEEKEKERLCRSIISSIKFIK